MVGRPSCPGGPPAPPPRPSQQRPQALRRRRCCRRDASPEAAARCPEASPAWSRSRSPAPDDGRPAVCGRAAGGEQRTHARCLALSDPVRSRTEPLRRRRASLPRRERRRILDGKFQQPAGVNSNEWRAFRHRKFRG